ncbi:MAG: type I restriction endonuclease subunit M, partial [Euryarchaeota archaeon]|nr:type I restriction endonuclease subunit M [Euryarchaeota archaeon]
WDCDLVPKQLVIKRYFAAEQKAVEQLEADRDAISRQIEELEEEHGGEEGLLEEAKTDKGKVTKALIQKRVKEIKNDADASEEMKVLEGYLKLIEKEADANKKIKDAQTALDKKVIARYKELTEDEVKILVVDDKWMAAISRDVKTELERISQRLTQRIKELAERYATPMPELNTMVDGLEAKVNKHLEKMGFVWK